LATGFQQTLLKLLIIQFTFLLGIQVVVGSNSVAADRKRGTERLRGEAGFMVFLFCKLIFSILGRSGAALAKVKEWEAR